MMINVGFGTLLTALGAVPVSILPPIMLSLGFSSFVAIALPAIGYDALTTYALLGIPVVVFANTVGIPVQEVGIYFARFMPVISTCIAMGMLWIVGGWKMMRKGAIPALISGLIAGFVCIGMNQLGLITVTGIAAGSAVIIAMLVYLMLMKTTDQRPGENGRCRSVSGKEYDIVGSDFSMVDPYSYILAG